MVSHVFMVFVAVVACLVSGSYSIRDQHMFDFSEPRSSDKPWFCHDIDCPEFKVVNTTDDYEVRYYEQGVWVSTDIETYAYAIASTTGFKRLFTYISGGNEDRVNVPMTAPRLYAYIGGSNEDEIKIPMTAPVRTRISTSSGAFSKKNFTVGFFVPFDLQDHPPKPTSPDVYIEKSPAFTAFVSQFGGFAMDDWTISGKAKALAESLENLGVEYETESFFYAQYDPPFRLTGRHNEVWILAKEEKVFSA